MYFYRRTTPLYSRARPAECLITLPKRSSVHEENDVVVSCDPAFVTAIRRAILPVAVLAAHVDEFVAGCHNAPRPVRVRSSRTFYQ